MNRLSGFNIVSLTLGFAFLYIPMVILVVYSFNESKLVTVWAGFSTKWYGELLRNEAFLDAAWVTVRVAFFSSCIATVGSSPKGCSSSGWSKYAITVVTGISSPMSPRTIAREPDPGDSSSNVLESPRKQRKT